MIPSNLKRWLTGALVGAALLAFVPRAIAEAPATRPPATQTQRAQQSKFIRYMSDPNGRGATLQASVVRYVNSDGDVVDLVAAIHVADKSFFKALDASFADYDAVLYELVAPSAMLTQSSTDDPNARRLRAASEQEDETPNDRRRKRRQRSLSMIGSLQQSLKDLLDLTFQLEQIDYHRPNFVHADLDAETFAKMQADRGESVFSLMLDQMIRGMSDPSMAANSPGIMDLINALRAPDRPRQLKILLGKQFGQLDELMAGFEGGDKESVLLTERNKAALRVLKQQMSETKNKNFAIFYGAAHLKGIEKSLVTEMGFHQVGPPFWRVAWDMTMPAPSTRPTTMPATVPSK